MSIICHASFIFLIFVVLDSQLLAGEIETQFSADIISGAEINHLKSQSLLNPKNETYQIYDKNLLLDLRPYLIFSFQNVTKLTLRPRFEGYYGSVNHSGETDYELRRDIWLNEGFLSLYPLDDLQVHVGRQSFLWGPSEVVGPSNPFYPDILNRPNPLFQLRGVTMARINYSFNGEFTLIGMAELNSLQDSDFDIRPWEEEDNSHRTLIKGEYASNDGKILLGTSVGQNKIQPSLFENSYSQFIGNYFMWTLSPAAQVYIDLRLDLNQDKLWPYYVTGLRSTFRDGTEWRNEYIHKELGLNRQQRVELEQLLMQPELSSSLAKSLNRNQDNLLSEDYYYSSLRMNINHLKSLDNSILGLRLLYSLTSKSGILSTFVEGGLNDRLTLVSYFSQSFGEDFGEFNSVINSSFGFFIKVSL